jgi:putative transposase
VRDVSKSGYYAWRDRPKSDQELRKEKLTGQIKRKRAHVESRNTYGSPKITKHLNRKGIKVSQKTVTRIMKENKIRSKTVKKYKATIGQSEIGY